jgi:lipopolysaccharide/colanic/teichoic acid biosynthesis glycosyltransferase
MVEEGHSRVDQPEMRVISRAPTAAYSRDRSYWAHAAMKRTLDISIGLTGLLLSSPVLLMAMIAIVLSSSGPVIYRHPRCGRGGVMFHCWKFRTMVTNADSALLADPALAEAYQRDFKLMDDPRVTRVGRLLRRTSVDELPQLWNVLRGDMSLVGPRPVTRHEYDSMYGQLADVVFSVRPGLTGLWQVSGRSSLPYHQRIALDLHYVRNRSLRADLKILAKTPATLVRDAA